MSKCVFRTDMRNQPVSEFLMCVEPGELFFNPAAPTVEECVHMLVGADEICLGASDKREVMQGARVVGYIRIVDAV
jgi:hypothetical protein